ncbi:MAG: hypothetical protein WCA36_13740 [Pseudolabrys sp.]|jgi:hypothetical protein
MRKLLLVSGLLAAGMLLSGNPASAATGCACATLTKAPVCVASIDACIAGMHGICVAPCDYHPPLKKMRHHKKKSMKKM